MRHIFVFIVLLILTSCVGPLVPVVKVDKETAQQLDKEIPTIPKSELNTLEYDALGSVSSTSCKNLLTDPAPSREDAVAQLKFKASALGADAITNVMCEAPNGTSLATNCWSSINCYATAIKYSENKKSSKKTSENKIASSGSGFFVTGDGVILTNNHVVDSCNDIEALSSSGNYIATILRSDPRNDLAILKVTGTKSNPLNFREGTPVRSGDNVVALGFPLSGLLAREPHVSSGIITALAGLGDDTSYLQISAPLQPGNSGGPLLDEFGNVVGVIVAKLDALLVAIATGDIPQNVNFAIKSNVAQAFLEANEIDYLRSSNREGYSVADNASNSKESVVFLKCN